MAYDLQWINGPKAGDAPDQYKRRAHFHASEQMMAALREEMKRQGMIGSTTGTLVGEWQAKLGKAGQVVTPTNSSRRSPQRPTLLRRSIPR